MAKYKIIPSSRTIVQSPISIGHKAEKGVEAIEFDLTAWVETYGSGTLTVIMRRWGDAIPYPIALEIGEDNKATWTLSDIDTAKAGMAYAQLNYIVGETVVKKSDIYTFRVMDSLTGEGDPPEAYESWLEHLTHFAAEAMAEVLDIEGIVTDKTLTVDGGIADGKATGDALALKADKATTYTKAEVDQMIEDVEVETDTTLEIAGAPADAKAVGDELGAINKSLGDVKADLNPLYRSISLSLIPNSYWTVSGGNAGTPAQYVGWSRTGKIQCTEGETLYINATVASTYNLFFNSNADRDKNDSFSLNVGDNVIKVPTGAKYFALSNTTEGMEGTVVSKIISADDVDDAIENAENALNTSESNSNDIDFIGRYVRLYNTSKEYETDTLIASTEINRRTEYVSANGIKSVSVNAVSGYQHNINYFKTSPSDADAVSEAGWQNDATSFPKPDGYLYLYVRFRKADQSTFTDADVNTLLESLVITFDYETISVPQQTVYVSSSGADTNDGSKNSPFATLQKAVDSGALVVKAKAGDYTGFSVQGRETPLTIMLDSMPTYSVQNPEVPKIKITTGITNGYGIYADNCTEINLYDIWVDGVTADCMWFQNVGDIKCTRCFVSNNSADNSMGIRLISVNGVFRDCKAWNIVKDGFNIHRYGNTQFINCVAHDCGDDGISHHDGCTGLISGGEYYRCYKGGISSPYGGAKIDIENAYIHDCTQYGIYSMSTSEMLKSYGRISNCVIKNNGTYDIIATYTDLVGWNNIYDTKSVGAQATFTEY